MFTLMELKHKHWQATYEITSTGESLILYFWSLNKKRNETNKALKLIIKSGSK